jgi:hypothetical protein
MTKSANIIGIHRDAIVSQRCPEWCVADARRHSKWNGARRRKLGKLVRIKAYHKLTANNIY